MSIAEAMLRTQLDEANQAARAMERQLRIFLAGALCAKCGEPLGDAAHGDNEIVMDDDERTVHKQCEF